MRLDSYQKKLRAALSVVVLTWENPKLAYSIFRKWSIIQQATLNTSTQNMDGTHKCNAK